MHAVFAVMVAPAGRVTTRTFTFDDVDVDVGGGGVLPPPSFAVRASIRLCVSFTLSAIDAGAAATNFLYSSIASEFRPIASNVNPMPRCPSGNGKV